MGRGVMAGGAMRFHQMTFSQLGMAHGVRGIQGRGACTQAKAEHGQSNC
jgi:hypothetical protein